MVKHSKCKKCHQIKNMAYLKKRDDGDLFGMVCIDEEDCKKQILKNQTKQQ